MARQMTLDGNSVPTGTVKDQVEDILRRHPDARNSYKALCYHYWVECDGLLQAIATCCDDQRPVNGDPFREWFVSKATSPKTLQNRCMEVQRERPGLDACVEVREWRDAQAKAGPVGIG